MDPRGQANDGERLACAVLRTSVRRPIIGFIAQLFLQNARRGYRPSCQPPSSTGLSPVAFQYLQPPALSAGLLQTTSVIKVDCDGSTGRHDTIFLADHDGFCTGATTVSVRAISRNVH